MTEEWNICLRYWVQNWEVSVQTPQGLTLSLGTQSCYSVCCDHDQVFEAVPLQVIQSWPLGNQTTITFTRLEIFIVVLQDCLNESNIDNKNQLDLKN